MVRPPTPPLAFTCCAPRLTAFLALMPREAYGPVSDASRPILYVRAPGVGFASGGVGVVGGDANSGLPQATSALSSSTARAAWPRRRLVARAPDQLRTR